MIFLYVGSIFAIMCIYISLLIDQCPSLTKSRENLTADPEIGSLGSTGFDTLKRAHISRARTPRTSFYLRVGALGLILVRFVVFDSKSIIKKSFVLNEQFLDWPHSYLTDLRSQCTPRLKESVLPRLFSLIRFFRLSSPFFRCTSSSSILRYFLMPKKSIK